MIPYDDLVAALASWRGRQGLPTGQIPAGSSPTAVPTQPAPASPSAATRSAAPAPAARPPAAVAADFSHEDSVDVDESALLEESSFDSEFGSAFDAVSQSGEATAIGAPPTPPRRGGR